MPLSIPPVSFPPGVYSDVRVERVATTTIVVRDGVLQELSVRSQQGAMLRVLKGGRWYYASTTDLSDT